jgi:hypothetical protein
LYRTASYAALVLQNSLLECFIERNFHHFNNMNRKQQISPNHQPPLPNPTFLIPLLQSHPNPPNINMRLFPINNYPISLSVRFLISSPSSRHISPGSISCRHCLNSLYSFDHHTHDIPQRTQKSLLRDRSSPIASAL